MSTVFPARPELNTQPRPQPGLQAGVHTSTRNTLLPGAADASNGYFHLTENDRNVWFLFSMEAVATSILHSHHYATACANKLLTLKVYNHIN